MQEKKEILRAENIKKYFLVKGNIGKEKQQVKAVDGVSFSLREGETLGLVGETGCGKSTLGRTVLKLLEPTEGKILYEGKDLSGLSENAMRPYRKEMQMIFQDPFTSLNPRKQVGQILEKR